MIPGLYFYLIN